MLYLTEDDDDLLVVEEDAEDVVMETVVVETTDVVSRKRKAIESVNDVASGDFVTSKKRCTADTDLDSNSVN